MLLEEGVEELSLCPREGLDERVFLIQNLCPRTVDDPHPLAVVCDHVFAVCNNPVEATTARDDVLYRRKVVGDEDVVAVSARENVVFRSFA